jgi:anti-sigma B factor antagonist
MYLSIFVRCSAGTAMVEVTGDLDVNSAPWLQERLLSALRMTGDDLLADLSGVAFIDCFALRMLVETRRRAELQACSMRFTALSRQAERLAELTGLRAEIPLTGKAAINAGAGRSGRCLAGDSARAICG